MRLRLIYLYRNITRNMLRAVLTCAAVALPITIYVLSMAVVDGVSRFLDNSSKQLRLAVMQKSSIANPLPAGHRAKIQSLDPTHNRIVSICGVRWIGGKVERDPRPLSTLAVDMDAFSVTFPEYALSPSELAAWQRDRQAIIVGSSTARNFGWKVGDRITINPSVPPYATMEFHVISTLETARDPLTNWCRRDYLDEELKKGGYAEGMVTFFFVKCGSQSDLNHFRLAIDALFARSPDETKTQDEKTFMNEFITQQFNLPWSLRVLALVTVFVAIMAATNTMSMNFRDRMNEVATLKSLGFSGLFVFALIQTESMLLCALGGLIGAAAPYLLFTYTGLRDMHVPLIQRLQINPVVCVHALSIAVIIGVLAAIWPSWQGVRMKVVSALRNLE